MAPFTQTQPSAPYSSTSTKQTEPLPNDDDIKRIAAHPSSTVHSLIPPHSTSYPPPPPTDSRCATQRTPKSTSCTNNAVTVSPSKLATISPTPGSGVSLLTIT
ncbi:hypothetical protein E8E12_010057 [Didymella heteroderae]|uniref:Uncharacterized protein n=1 Tax=Didymella heteroderae TaxID=1769908 RepID=A0A9P4WWF0_9PLEO|nr:hypothetical protein E8E12_010057 [Didymella heteroderae]